MLHSDTLRSPVEKIQRTFVVIVVVVVVVVVVSAAGAGAGAVITGGAVAVADAGTVTFDWGPVAICHL